jgi:cytochrome c55X
MRHIVAARFFIHRPLFFLDQNMRYLTVLAIVFASPLVLAQAAVGSAVPTVQRQKEIVHLVRQDCGSCHGMTLQGGLGPSLKPEALRDKPIESLVATIHGGRPGTPMPPWHRFLTEAEAQWIVEQLLQGFPHQ